MPITLCVVVNSFNRIGQMRDALASLQKTLPELRLESAVVVFDAGSTDGSVEFLKEFKTRAGFPVHVISPAAGEDGSFSAGVNAACGFAAQTYPQLKWLLLYETDNAFRSAAPLKAALELLDSQSTLSAAGFTVQRYDGSPAGYGARFPTRRGMIAGPQMAHRLGLESPNVHWQSSGAIQWSECEVVYTSPLLIKADAWATSGGLDAKEFPFSECDVDWCWRLKKAGWRIGVIQTADAIHDNRNELSSWSSDRVVKFHRARYRLLKRHRGSMGWLRPLLFLRHLAEWFVLLLLFVLRRRPWAAVARRGRMMGLSLSGYE